MNNSIAKSKQERNSLFFLKGHSCGETRKRTFAMMNSVRNTGRTLKVWAADAVLHSNFFFKKLSLYVESDLVTGCIQSADLPESNHGYCRFLAPKNIVKFQP